MKCYIVTFEVANESSRKSILEQLKTESGYCPINHTCCAIVSDKGAKTIRDKLTKCIEDGDSLFVVKSGVESAWRISYGSEHNEWLKKNLQQ